MRMPYAALERWEQAVERVKGRAQQTSETLEKHGIPYQVIGGLAVAAWVATVDEYAVRGTPDVDLMIRRGDLDRARATLEKAGLALSLEPCSTRPRRGPHAVFENEVIRIPEHPPRSPLGFAIAPLESLLRMKLMCFRTIDRVHLFDLLEVELITPEIESTLPRDLLARLRELQQNPEG